MKKMLDELKELNNEDTYEIPEGFRDRVVERIQKDDESNLLKCIIPACSVAAALLIAVVINGKVKNDSNVENIMLATGEINNSVNEMYDTNGAYFDDMLVADFESSAEELKSINEAAMPTTQAKNLARSEYEDEILSMLQLNKVEAEKVDGVIKAKAKKEDIEVILYYFAEQIDITQDGEYVIIKEK